MADTVGLAGGTVGSKVGLRHHISAAVADGEAARGEVEGDAVGDELVAGAAVVPAHMALGVDHREEGATTDALEPRREHRAAAVPLAC